MATVTVRNLDPVVVSALKAIGAEQGRSMEAEARVILAAAARSRGAASDGTRLGSRISDRFVGLSWDALAG